MTVVKSIDKKRFSSEQSGSVYNEVRLLEAVSTTPESTQAALAAQVGVAVGTVNWYLKRWAAKGFVTIKRVDRRRWRYLLTPQGVAHKAVLARKYVAASMVLYRRTRAEARRLLTQVQEAGYDKVLIDGDGEIAEICRLTCLEMGIEVVVLPGCDLDLTQALCPLLKIDGTDLSLVNFE